MKLRLTLVLACIFSVSCAALLSPLPGVDGSAQVRQQAGRVADAVTTGLVILDQAGQFIDTAPIPADKKDALDCGIMKATGHDAPSATVLKVCGPIPDHASAPLTTARNALRKVSTEPGLKATIQTLLGVIDPLIAKLASSGQPPLVSFANILRVTFGFATLLVGGQP